MLYQALIALFTCVELTLLKLSEPEDGTSLTLVLEPGAGDQEQRRSGRRIVEQIKSRSSGKAWSLREFIEKVLPDLYRAVDLTQPETTYRFVTNSGIGEWRKVYEDFFRSLENRPEPADPSADLRDRPPNLCVGRDPTVPRKSLFWGRGPYTERRLFHRIVSHLRSRKAVATEQLKETQTKTRHLLGRLDIQEERDFAGYEAVVDAWLRGQVDTIETLPEKRDALLTDLLKKAGKGSARIVPDEFFRGHGLSRVPLKNWSTHMRRARAVLASELTRHDYTPGRDARPDLARSLAAEWRTGPPILALTGEGGQGKTWLGWSLLSHLAAQGELVLFVEATGDPARDLDVEPDPDS